MKWISAILLLFVALAMLGAALYTESFAVDRCLDSGGSFNYQACQCDFVDSHEKPAKHSCNFEEEQMEWIKITSVVGAFIVIIVGMSFVFSRLKAKEQGFGPNSLRAIGIVIFVPVLLILAVVTEFKTETLAALLGAVAGYVLSNSKPNDE